MANTTKAILLSKLIYPSSVISTPSKAIHYLWNGKDELSGFKTIDYEIMTKALRLSWPMYTDE